jgi:hypothetical protein
MENDVRRASLPREVSSPHKYVVGILVHPAHRVGRTWRSRFGGVDRCIEDTLRYVALSEESTSGR